MKYVTLEHWINHNDIASRTQYFLIQKIFEFKNDFILEVVTNSIPSETEAYEFEMLLPKTLHAIALWTVTVPTINLYVLHLI